MGVKHLQSDGAADANVSLLSFFAIRPPPPLCSFQQLLQRIWLPHGAQVSGAERCVEGVPHSSVSIQRKLFRPSFTHSLSNSVTRAERCALCRPTSYQDPAFFEECKQEYIKEKLEFERTGIPTKNRKQKLPTSM